MLAASDPRPSACCSTWRTTPRRAVTSRRIRAHKSVWRWCTPRMCRDRAADATPNARDLPVRRAGTRPRRPARRLRGARGRGLSWLGDRRAGRGARPGRLRAPRCSPASATSSRCSSSPCEGLFPDGPSSLRVPGRPPPPLALGGRGGVRRRRDGRRRQAAGRRGRAAARHAAPSGRPGARRRARRRQAVHVLHLARDAEEADALPDPQRRRGRPDARLPARRRRTRRSPAPRRPVVQLRRRQRLRLLEPLDARSRPARLEKMGRIVHAGRHQDGQRPRPRRARGPHALGDRPERHAAGRRGHHLHLPRHRRRAAHDRSRDLPAARRARTSRSPTTRKGCSACASAALSRIRPRRAASSSTRPAR